MTDQLSFNIARKLTESEQDFLKHQRKQLRYSKGENIFKQGAFAAYVIYVKLGLVKVYLQTSHNKKVNLRIAKAGDFLAFASVFGEDVYTYSTVAIENTEICMIDKDGLRQLLFNNNNFAISVTSRIFKEEKDLLEKIANISHKQMRGKLATALLYLSRDEFLKENIFTHLSRQDIADFATISTESAIKFLKEFEKENIIALNGKDIAILKKDLLTEISVKG